MYDVEGDAAEEEVGRAERGQVHLLEVRVPHAVRPQLLQREKLAIMLETVFKFRNN